MTMHTAEALALLEILQSERYDARIQMKKGFWLSFAYGDRWQLHKHGEDEPYYSGTNLADAMAAWELASCRT